MTLSPATPAFLDALRDRLPAGVFREAEDWHLTEPRGRFRGTGTLLAPGSTREVATILRACHEARVAVVPHSGGTGLVGGQLLSEGPAPVILSLARMDRVRAVHPAESVLVAEAGVILADVQAAAERAGRLFPLSLASEGSARIGGLLATNAGGTQVIRYGNARALCLGVEAVTAQGEVWHGLSRLRKDNAGYDLRDLLIGSEGTLGVITAAALRLVQPPAAVGVALLAVPSPGAALDLLAVAQGRYGDAVQGFELMGRMGFDFLEETGLGASPLRPTPDWTVLVELGLPEGIAAGEALERLFEEGAERGLVADGVLAGRLDVVMVPVDGGLTLDHPTLVRTLERFKARVVVPMHWFGRGTLDSFLSDMEQEAGYEVERREESELTLTLGDLPDRLTVVVLEPGLLAED